METLTPSLSLYYIKATVRTKKQQVVWAQGMLIRKCTGHGFVANSWRNSCKITSHSQGHSTAHTDFSSTKHLFLKFCGALQQGLMTEADSEFCLVQDDLELLNFLSSSPKCSHTRAIKAASFKFSWLQISFGLFFWKACLEVLAGTALLIYPWLNEGPPLLGKVVLSNCVLSLGEARKQCGSKGPPAQPYHPHIWFACSVLIAQ